MPGALLKGVVRGYLGAALQAQVGHLSWQWRHIQWVFALEKTTSLKGLPSLTVKAGDSRSP